MDPAKDRMAYFKDNVQTAADDQEFDASQYYYSRDEGGFSAGGRASGSPTLIPNPNSMNASLSNSGFGQSAFSTGGGLQRGDSGNTSSPMRLGGQQGGPSGQRFIQSPIAGRQVSHPTGMQNPYNAGIRRGYGSSRLGTLQENSSGGSSSGQLDMSEFPALAPNCRAGGISIVNDNEGGSSIGGNRFTEDNSDFIIQNEDFPALGFSGGHSMSGDVGLNQALDAATHLSTASKPDAEELMKNDGASRYGLLGLLNVIRMTNKDLNTLALGIDLTALGLNLNSTDCLYSTFASPWADTPAAREPQYSLPLCYYMQPPALKTSHLSKLQLETLFYIFYAMPKDVLQAYAAQELYNREWQYHMDLKLWFKRATPADALSSSAGAQYIYFDINAWERRLFAGNIHGGLNAGLLSEDEVRVKFNSP